MEAARGIIQLTRRAAGMLRDEGPASVWMRFLQWLGIYRRLFVLGGLDSRRPETSRVPITCERLRVDGVDDYMEFRPDQDRAEIEARLASGNLCCVARKNGRIIATTWTAIGKAWIDYLQCEIRLADDAVYHFDTYVRPEFRGCRVAGELSDLRLKTVTRLGYVRSVGLFWPENRAAIQRSERRKNIRVGEFRCFKLGPWRCHALRLEPGHGEPLLELAPQHRGIRRTSGGNRCR
jgi:GNAT superfamily N-acetyltransferase